MIVKAPHWYQGFLFTPPPPTNTTTVFEPWRRDKICFLFAAGGGGGGRNDDVRVGEVRAGGRGGSRPLLVPEPPHTDKPFLRPPEMMPVHVWEEGVWWWWWWCWGGLRGWEEE